MASVPVARVVSHGKAAGVGHRPARIGSTGITTWFDALDAQSPRHGLRPGQELVMLPAPAESCECGRWQQ